MNEKLYEKLVANSLRLKAREQQSCLMAFYEKAPPTIVECLGSAPTYFAPDARRFESLFPRPVGMITDSVPSGLPGPNPEYRDTDCWNDVLTTLKTFRCAAPVSCGDHCQVAVPALLRLGFQLPLWQIDLSHYGSLIVDLTAQLKPREGLDFAWVALDGKAGVALSHYCGYLEPHRQTSSQEIVYEIINWGCLQSTSSTPPRQGLPLYSSSKSNLDGE